MFKKLNQISSYGYQIKNDGFVSHVHVTTDYWYRFCKCIFPCICQRFFRSNFSSPHNVNKLFDEVCLHCGDSGNSIGRTLDKYGLTELVWTPGKRNERSGPGAQKYCSNEDGCSSPAIKRRSFYPDRTGSQFFPSAFAFGLHNVIHLHTGPKRQI